MNNYHKGFLRYLWTSSLNESKLISFLEKWPTERAMRSG